MAMSSSAASARSHRTDSSLHTPHSPASSLVKTEACLARTCETATRHAVVPCAAFLPPSKRQFRFVSLQSDRFAAWGERSESARLSKLRDKNGMSRPEPLPTFFCTLSHPVAMMRASCTAHTPCVQLSAISKSHQLGRPKIALWASRVSAFVPRARPTALPVHNVLVSNRGSLL